MTFNDFFSLIRSLTETPETFRRIFPDHEIDHDQFKTLKFSGQWDVLERYVSDKEYVLEMRFIQGTYRAVLRHQKDNRFYMEHLDYILDSELYNISDTYCTACNRRLKDSTSVEMGIGPTCRANYNYEDAPDFTPEMLEALESQLGPQGLKLLKYKNSRPLANRVVKTLSLIMRITGVDSPDVVKGLSILRTLGYEVLADKIQNRQTKVDPKIHLILQNNRLSISAPYNPEFVDAIKQIRQRRYNPTNKSWSVPYTLQNKRRVYAMLLEYYKGEKGVGPQGEFIL